MKKLSLLCALLGVGYGAMAASIQYPAPVVKRPLAKKPEIALLIGNSYSFYNCGVHSYLRGLAKESHPKEKIKTRLLTISSGSLSFHDVPYYLKPHDQDPYAHVKNGKLERPMFDVVLLQENSAGATSDKRYAFFQEYAKKHIESIKAAGSQPLIVMTWAKKHRPDDMQKIAQRTIEIANANQAMVVPVGLAFAKAIEKCPDLELYMPDRSHPSAVGSYLYGAVLYATLFHRSPQNNAFEGECEKPLPEDVRLFIQDIAWETVQEFFGWK